MKQRKCPGFLFPSKPFLGRCIPDLSVNTTKSNQPLSSILLRKKNTVDVNVRMGTEHVLEELKAHSLGQKLLADLALDWWLLLLAVLAASVLSFIWIVLLQLAAGVIVYCTIVLSCLILMAGTGFAFYNFYLKLKEGETFVDEVFTVPSVDKIVDHYLDKDTWLTIAIIMAVITVVILLVLMFLLKRIRIAVLLIKEASRAVRSACCTLIFPILPFLLQLVILLWFLGVASCLATAGEKEFRVRQVDIKM